MTRRRSLFLFAYVCSGFSGLVYEVSWTRLLTLYMGHTTAAASTVVAAFMGGLAGGALFSGRLAPRFTLQQCLTGYIFLEGVVALLALTLPFELEGLRPLLSSAYADGSGGTEFAMVRLFACLMLLVVPAAALGATFPLAVRAFTIGRDGDAGRLGGTLYALNTAGAALGALSAGFVLIPTVGLSGATWVGVGAAFVAMGTVAFIAYEEAVTPSSTEANALAGLPTEKVAKASRKKPRGGTSRSPVVQIEPPARVPVWLVPAVLAATGFSSLMFEISWMRVLALALGPTTYAFATTVAALIIGLALGSGLGAWAAGRTRRPAGWLAIALLLAAVAASIACALAGGEVPRRIAAHVAASPDSFGRMLARAVALGALLVAPASIGFGAAFPLALSLFGAATPGLSPAAVAGRAYAINTMAAVAGSLLTGFVAIPVLGLEQTLRLVTAILLMAGLSVVFWGGLPGRVRGVALVVSVAAVAIFAFSPPWDRALLASGVYKYSAYVAKGIDLVPALKAGTLLYYREGAASTVTVKRLTGTTTLAIDGKVDASNASDMLTQKLIAHLPLLLHDNPQEICIIGVGSGVTLGAALRHPVARADVLEISPQVVEASRHFAAENYNALDDPRTHLIVGDGRSHLALSTRKYDVIISEPSNPWIAGVASLFTREFFLAAKDRLNPGGIISQWAHTYNISGEDLRSIVATFTSVFPNGTVWMVGQDDVLLVASNERLDDRLERVAGNWNRPGVAEDLRSVSAMSPFAVWSLYVGGPEALKQYSAGAVLQGDDRTALEFSGPRSMDNRDAGANADRLLQLADPSKAPAAISRAIAGATAADWRARGAMMLKADVPGHAFDDYARALAIDKGDEATLDGLVRTAVLAGRVEDAVGQVSALTATHPQAAVWVAKSRLAASQGATDAALEAAREASLVKPLQPIALEQLGSLFNELSDVEQLDIVVKKLREIAPERPATPYYAAVAALHHDDPQAALKAGEEAIAMDARYAAAYDVVGAAHLKLGRPEEARRAFETSLRFNAHDSTAYTNLGIIELGAGNREAAARHFGEALWLDPSSVTARQGLSQAIE